jgi:tetratricopeptide (TPR) repeat protein
MQQAAQKAVALDGSSPGAHIALCAAIMFNEHDAARADRECVRAVELDPADAEAYHMRARVLAAANRHEEGITQEKIASDLIPFGDQWGLARSYLWARRYDEGIEDAKRRLESSPRNAEVLKILADLYRGKGMYAEAVKSWEEMYSAEGDEASAANVRSAFRLGGYPAVLHWKLDNLKERSQKHYVSPVFFALLYAQLGQREKALGALEEAYTQRSPLLLWIQCDPAYDFLHSDERYRSLMRRVGMPAAN